MNKQNVRVGAFVRFAHPNGSTGKIVHVNGDNIYVEWVYGRDARGEIVHASSGGQRVERLEEITLTEYQAAANRAFNSEGT